MRYSTVAGFTLLELMIALAIGALTLGMAIPSIGNILNTNQIAAEVNALHGSLDLARSEAVRRNDLVILCKSPDGQKCSKKASWSEGWIVFADTDHNKARDDGEKLILVHAALSKGHTLKYRGFGSKNYITYRSTGMTEMNGTFTFCAADAPAHARALILIKSGRVRFSRTQPDGSPLNCNNSSS